ncbi:magnesium/cobalt transporter CorA [Neobacillus terrae]|uniref:magnesium/cobalt transporter CorA n=1 Tax=Neobacillus terrae TaxID=3034837 RepID=UPI00140889E5|nr:magnesium/cobalt transporter CorA [Neobacillus terrae]NHM34050.1 magnesium/cobalt transporter CorA [Neobacillus terrae]
MIRILAVDNNNQITLGLEITELMKKDYVWYWVDFDRPDSKETELLSDPFHFHPLAIEDCLHTLQRPKLDYYENHAFFVFQLLNKESWTREEVDVFFSENYMVTYHNQESGEINKVWERLLKADNLKKCNASLVFYEILDKIVDSYFPLMEMVEDGLNQIDENSENKPAELLLGNLFKARHHLLLLRRVIFPMRDLVYRILNSERLSSVQLRKEYFANIYDHLIRLAEMVEANREFTTDIRESYLTLNSTQTNHVMKVLTVITTIFMPLTFIAGIYGMNFENMPELSWHYGYYGAIFLMFIIGMGMYLWFLKKGWFK